MPSLVCLTQEQADQWRHYLLLNYIYDTWFRPVRYVLLSSYCIQQIFLFIFIVILHFLFGFRFQATGLAKWRKKWKNMKNIFILNHLGKIITNELRREIIRKLVGKLNNVSKYSTFFGHTSCSWVDGFFNFHPRKLVRGGGAEIQMVPGRKKTSVSYWF